MEKSLLTRQYLESVSTSDLLNLADNYGIDIPDDLNRRFIIGELLEIAEDNTDEEEDVFVDEQLSPAVETFPSSYNETAICAILRNPAWAFVFWDISEACIKKIKTECQEENLCLRMTTFEDEEKLKKIDSFDIQIKLEDREQYVLIPGGTKYFIVELALNLPCEPYSQLAVTKTIRIPQGNESALNNQPGTEKKWTQLQQLSGMNRLLHDHFNNHRQSFS